MTADLRTAADAFGDATCTAPPERTRLMRDIVLRYLPSTGGARVLDLGCGTGSLIAELATARTDVSLVGIDVSAANIRAARARHFGGAPADRIRFEQADYLAYEAPPFDAIVTDGVLHLVPGSTETLFDKLAHDLRPGGRLICAMPYDCAYNRMFAVVRRLLRMVRSPVTDAAILHAGRMLHGREMDDTGLRERLRYMYIPPARLETRSLTTTLAPSARLHLIAQYPLRSVSLSQLRHRVSIFEKRER